MATTQGEATFAYDVQAAEAGPIGAIGESHGLWRRIGTRWEKTHGRRRDDVETLQSVWGWRICDRCRETLVLGEVVLSVPAGDGRMQVCPGCTGTWSTEVPARVNRAARAAADESPRQKTARADAICPAPKAGPEPEAQRYDAHAA
jgi:hypothetical protein